MPSQDLSASPPTHSRRIGRPDERRDERPLLRRARRPDSGIVQAGHPRRRPRTQRSDATPRIWELMKRTLVIVLAAALVGGLAGAVIGVALEGGDSSSQADRLPLSTPSEVSAGPTSSSRADLPPEAIYRTDAPSVVVITDTQTQTVPGSFFLPPSKEQVGSLGSGFVIDKRGDIATNEHVVQSAQAIRVGFSDGASYPATIVGTDPSSDVAVVRVKAPTIALRPLTFDDSSKLQVGDPTYAIGNPFGLDRTMTAGIVSAVGRDIESPNGLTIPNAIQTDAPINHGNSGGPLLDRDGRVVGIAAQIQGGT